MILTEVVPPAKDTKGLPSLGVGRTGGDRFPLENRLWNGLLSIPSVNLHDGLFPLPPSMGPVCLPCSYSFSGYLLGLSHTGCLSELGFSPLWPYTAWSLSADAGSAEIEFIMCP